MRCCRFADVPRPCTDEILALTVNAEFMIGVSTTFSIGRLGKLRVNLRNLLVLHHKLSFNT